MTEKQVNFLAGPATQAQLKFLKGQFGGQASALRIAIDRAYREETEMILAEKRKIAEQAARGLMRRMDIQPETQTADNALATLDDLLRLDPKRIASIWYAKATDYQIRLFIREWRQWRAEKVGLHAVVKEIEDAIEPLEFEKHGPQIYDISGGEGIVDDLGEYFGNWLSELDVPDGTEFTIKGTLPSTFTVFPKLPTGG